jgi:type IV pilus assembly protein PilO
MKKERHLVLQKGILALDKIVEELNQLTVIQRVMIFCGVFILLGGAFYYFAYSPKLEQINRLESRCNQLKQQLATAKKKAQSLGKYREEMKEAQVQFNAAMEALPDKTEIPSLLAAVSQAGKDAGLDFLLFEPRAERNKEFYAEIPVQIEVTGSYHQTATFFDKVSRLSRIVNIDHIHIHPGKNARQLKTSCVAVTYRFVEVLPKNQKGKKKR